MFAGVTSPLPPGPRLPGLVGTLGWVARPLPYVERCRRRYGDTFTLPVHRNGPWVVTCGEQGLRDVFTGDPRALHAGEANDVLRPVTGSHSLLLLDEDEHLRERRVVSPPLHGAPLRSYAQTMREVAEADVATWPRGGQVCVRERAQAVTLEIILRVVFGVRDAARLDRLRALVRDLLERGVQPAAVAVLALLGPEVVARTPPMRRVLRELDALLMDEIARRRAQPERDDVLSLLLAAGLEDRQVRDELVTLLLAGHETTATALAWTIERVVRHPAVLAELVDEQARGEHRWLDATIHEALRLRPPVPMVGRRLTRPTAIDGWELPAGTMVTPCVLLVNRDPRLWDDPLAFRPERFLDQPPPRYAWIPFGGGTRRCVGAAFALLELREVIGAMLRARQLAAAVPRSERVVRRSLTFAPELGALVTAT